MQDFNVVNFLFVIKWSSDFSYKDNIKIYIYNESWIKRNVVYTMLFLTKGVCLDRLRSLTSDQKIAENDDKPP
jgi:hypothetical protein